jgi:hypothetical protein
LFITLADVAVRRAVVAAELESRCDEAIGLGVDVRLVDAGGFGGFLSFEGGLA